MNRWIGGLQSADTKYAAVLLRLRIEPLNRMQCNPNRQLFRNRNGMAFCQSFMTPPTDFDRIIGSINSLY